MAKRTVKSGDLGFSKVEKAMSELTLKEVNKLIRSAAETIRKRVSKFEKNFNGRRVNAVLENFGLAHSQVKALGKAFQVSTISKEVDRPRSLEARKYVLSKLQVGLKETESLQLGAIRSMVRETARGLKLDEIAKNARKMSIPELQNAIADLQHEKKMQVFYKLFKKIRSTDYFGRFNNLNYREIVELGTARLEAMPDMMTQSEDDLLKNVMEDIEKASFDELMNELYSPGGL